MDRAEMIGKIINEDRVFDFVIIGGGATGIGILLEAVSRGYSAVLFEASDFTKSTSSKSTKLVHGGVRYLAQGNIGLVREASVERGRILQNAPHLSKNLSFIIPAYGFFDEIKYIIGLKIYDLLAGSFSLGRSYRISGKKVRSAFPNLEKAGLKGGIVYHDGQFDDSRLAVSLLKSAVELGAVAVNYMPVRKFFKDESGSLDACQVEDLETGNVHRINGRAFINATGVFADEIMEMDHEHHRISIRPSQGIHIVIDRKFLPGEHALMIPKTDDGRVLFAVPWHGKLVLGTTDTPVDHISNEPEALEEEIEFILRTAGKYLESPPGTSDILSVFAGLRPLAAPEEGKSKTKEISRSHKIIRSESGLLTIIGGKWTTYRKMAEDLVSRAEKEFNFKKTSSATKNLRIFGYLEDPDFNDPLYYYGSEIDEVRKSSDGKKDELLSPELGIYTSQVMYAVRREMARKPEDFLARRCRALLLDVRESIRIIEKVAGIMAAELGKDAAWISKEVGEYNQLASRYLPAGLPG